MEQVGSQERHSEEKGKGSPPQAGFARFVAAWIRVVVGLALVGEGGVLFADARTHWAGYGAWVGIVAMAVGALISLSGMWAIYAQSRGSRTVSAEEFPVAPEPAVPMLGALLVYKYKFITEEQLEKALEVQRKEGATRRRIGSILLDMGLVSMAEVQQALAYQRSMTMDSVTAAVPEGSAGHEQDHPATADGSP